MQKGCVFLVGFPRHIKDIAHNRDGSSQGVNTDVGYHPEEHSARCAQSNRLIQNIRKTGAHPQHRQHQESRRVDHRKTNTNEVKDTTHGVLPR